MRIGYLEPFAGISGDMLLGALVGAGVSPELLRATVASLNLGATLEIGSVTRAGMQAVKVDVRVDDHAADQPGHHHAHDHHGRHLATILELIGKAPLPLPVRELAARTFQLLGEAEAKIHGVPIDTIHFHEVGAVDAIVDIVAGASGLHALGVDTWHCSALNVGGGTVDCAHGRFPVPAPATAELLRGAPTYSSGLQMELVTPTGAALVRALGCKFAPAPALCVAAIGYGAGTRNPPGFANVLRLSVGESTEPDSTSGDTVTVLETAVDDLNPQIVAYVAERALQLGALDFMCAPVQMKKGRTGLHLTVLARPAHAAAIQDLLLRETSTLGVRLREERRVILQRDHVTVQTPWGPVRIKRGRLGTEEYNAAPEFEDCRRCAETAGVPLKRVLETALQLYRQGTP